jgi:repressor LexA
VAAGFPTAEEEELQGTISLEEYLIDKPTSTFMLEVKGDSMIDAGILPKDMVLVEKGRLAKSGDIVIAEVDGDWTMKYLRKTNGKTYLQAANANYPDIYPEKTLNIAGVVISTCRKYG